MKSNWKRNSLIYIIILLAAVLLFSFLIPGANEPQEIPLSRAITMSQNGEISKLQVDESSLLITTPEGKTLTTAIGNLTVVDLQELGLNLPEGGFGIKASGGSNWGSLLINFLPLVIFGLLLFFLFR